MGGGVVAHAWMRIIYNANSLQPNKTGGFLGLDKFG